MIKHLWTHRVRPRLFSKPWLKCWAKRALTFPTLFKSEVRSVWLRSRGARIGEDTILAPMVFSGNPANLEIGSRSFIGRVWISAHSVVRIGSNVCINDDVRIFTATHDVKDPAWKQIIQPVEIGDFVWIASAAIVLPGVRIGDGAVVGAGTVVSKDVPARAMAVGSPCRIIPERRSSELAYSPVDFIAGFRAWLADDSAVKPL